MLAPARDCEIARQAILHGADAVYIGADAFGARAAATNDTADISRLTDFAHSFNAKVYVTLNTLIYDAELPRAEALIRKLYRAGVDALIVQDMSVLRMDIPPIALHASTQCDTRTPEKAVFLENCGFSQIVLARELSLEQIRQIASKTSVPLEGFVHGALCVSYSGDCQASLLATGRSANRGECSQMCRLRYRLTDAGGKTIAPEGHYLSLRDMNRLSRLGDLIDAGISSFKIEGRLKDSNYVRNTVAAYSIALDRIIEASDGAYRRASTGRASYSFEPDVYTTFNRRFTQYFLDGLPSNGEKMSSLDSPKWIGIKVASVISTKGDAIKVKASQALNNGDGLGFFDDNGKFQGFRLNRVSADVIYPATHISISPGTPLYRNRDKKRDDTMSGETAKRCIDIDATLRRINNNLISLKLTDCEGISAEATALCEYQAARSPQKDNKRRVISKLGDSIYSLKSYLDLSGEDSFIAASILAELRRNAVKLLDRTRMARYRYDYRREEKKEIAPFKNESLDYHDNVANRLAKKFYSDHGIEISQDAIEVTPPPDTAEVRVMTTKYCIRRELGACLRTPGAKRLPSPLFLSSANTSYRIEFNCSGCEMHVIRIKAG